MHAIAGAQAAAGDTPGALATLAPLGPLAMQWQALEGVVRALAARGDVAVALRTIASEAAGHPALTAKLTFAVAEAQAESGDLAGAVTTVRSVQSPDTESKVRAVVAVAQAKSGDVAGALATARTITGANRLLLGGMLAAYQAKAGDVAGALQTAEAIPEGGSHGGYGLRGAALLGVASVQASRGDLAGARGTAQRITEPSMREQVVVPIARAQAKSDVAAALGLARAAGDPVTRARALEAVVMVQARG